MGYRGLTRESDCCSGYGGMIELALKVMRSSPVADEFCAAMRETSSSDRPYANAVDRADGGALGSCEFCTGLIQLTKAQRLIESWNDG